MALEPFLTYLPTCCHCLKPLASSVSFRYIRTRFKKLHLSAGTSPPLKTALATFSRLYSCKILSNVSIASLMRSEEAILRLLFCMSSFVPVFFLARFQELEALFPLIDIAGFLIPAFFTVTAHNTKWRGHNLPPLSVHFGHFTTFFVTKA